jgi:hypothetical protein
MPPELGSYVSWADANNGNPSTLSQFRTCLSRYSRSKVVYLCGILNSFLRIWEGSKGFLEAHAELLRYAFPSPWSENLIAASTNPTNKRVVFHRQQLLFVAKEAILHCGEQAEDPFSLPYWGKLGAVFLMANDHLHFRQPSTASEVEKTIGMLPNLVLVQEYSAANRLAYRVVRSHLMYTRFATGLSERAHSVDLARAFQKLTGLTLVEYEALCFGTLSKYMKVNLAAFKANPSTFLLSACNFQSTAVPADKVKLFLAEVSATAEQFRSYFAKKDAGLVDFTWFRDRPLLRQGDTLYALDLSFLGDKIETGPFWRVFNALPDDRSKKRLHAFWGALFEEYLNWLFRGSVDGPANIYYHSPKYVSDGAQVCDGIIRCGSSALLMEYKGSTFTAEAKYGGNGSLLVKEIKKKLVLAEKEKKGVAQLANAIHRLFRRGGHEQVEGIDLSSVKTIFPVLVTRDEIGGTMMVNRLLDNEFQQTTDKRSVRPHRVTPLFCLTADEVEYVSAYLRTVRFSDVLQERYEADSSLQTPLQFWELPSLAANLRNELLKREFENFSNGVAKTLFPDAPPLRHPWRDDDPEDGGL